MLSRGIAQHPQTPSTAPCPATLTRLAYAYTRSIIKQQANPYRHPAPQPLSICPRVTQPGHTCCPLRLPPSYSAGLAFSSRSAPSAQPTAAVPNSFHLPQSHNHIPPTPLMLSRGLPPPLFLGTTVQAQPP